MWPPRADRAGGQSQGSQLMPTRPGPKGAAVGQKAHADGSLCTDGEFLYESARGSRTGDLVLHDQGEPAAPGRPLMPMSGCSTWAIPRPGPRCSAWPTVPDV
jgi:hypothetical protein